MRYISNISQCENFTTIKRVKVIKSCTIQNFNVINKPPGFGQHNILFVSHMNGEHHSHFLKDLLFQFSYYFKLKELYKDIILYIPQSNNFINEFINLLKINCINRNITIDCKNLFFLDNVYGSEHDMGNDGKRDFKEHIFFYRKKLDFPIKNPKYCCDLNNIKYDTYYDVINIVDNLLNNIKSINIEDKYKNDKVYFSRRNDPRTGKFYYLGNMDEISDKIGLNALELSPPRNLTILEKILYINNCNTFIIENCSALQYALFAKPNTNIIILTGELMYYGNSSIIQAIKNKFKNVKIIKGYDKLLVGKDFHSFQKMDRHRNLNTDESVFMGFFFDKEDNIENIFGNKLKIFQRRRIHINNKNEEVTVYEFVNNNNINHPKINDKYYKYIAGNTINSRFQISQSNFNYIMNQCKKNNIEVNGITLNFWNMESYIIDINDINV